MEYEKEKVPLGSFPWRMMEVLWHALKTPRTGALKKKTGLQKPLSRLQELAEWQISKYQFSDQLPLAVKGIFQFVNVVYYIDWFEDIEESLHPWDKAHLVMMYDLFNVLLDSVCFPRSLWEEWNPPAQDWSHPFRALNSNLTAPQQCWVSTAHNYFLISLLSRFLINSTLLS